MWFWRQFGILINRKKKKLVRSLNMLTSKPLCHVEVMSVATYDEQKTLT